MASPTQDVYATLLTNDQYLPGALVVAHSLKDAGTTKQVAVLVTDGVSIDAIDALRKIFDLIIPVERMVNEFPDNLHLMNRADLHSTFTKIMLWKQLQFRKVVYVDADMVALRAPDELFDLPHAFSAAPDIGWPDIFNSGLMVLSPNMGDYFALQAMAQRGISFDGADQGLLNMHFKNTFNRLSFTYNVTPSAHYQYLPAFRHFQSSISMAHFIGPNKPWTQGREANLGNTPYDGMVARWWAVYDKHYRESVNSAKKIEEPEVDHQQSVESSARGGQSLVHYLTKGEFNPTPIASTIPISTSQEVQPEETESEILQQNIESPHHDSYQTPREEDEAYIGPVHPHSGTTLEKEQEPEPEQERVPVVQYSAWDAGRAPPPADSKPEASNFPATHYEMSSDVTPFKAPERYPDPPKNMYYEVPKTPTYQKPAPIFPWEMNQPKASRVFQDDAAGPTEFLSSSNEIIHPRNEDASTPVTPTTPIIQVTTADPWQSYTHANAWDDIPEIERYIGKLQKNRKGNIQVLQGYGTGQIQSPGARRGSMRLTDFPSEVDRPSLPVTPAPIRKPTFWGTDRDEDSELPNADGVPSQEEWDPVVQLEQLARRQSEVLANKLGNDSLPAREIPLRPLPYGSEGVKSPTYEAQTSGSASRTPTIAEPSYSGPGAAWDKDEQVLTQETPMKPSEEELDALDN